MWTEKQLEAISQEDKNILVSAAAGSGKTAVLVERIKRIITEKNIDIDSLLIVTFTNAAAAEMRERIANSIIHELDTNKNAKNEEFLRKQLNILNRAHISTIHSFCINVVKKYFHLINIDPNFRICDETENNLIKIEALEELLDDEYKNGKNEFLGLVDRYGSNRSDETLGKMILDIHSFIQSQPQPLEWLQHKVEEFNVNSIENSIWYKEIIKQISVELIGAKDCFESALLLCRKPDGPSVYEDALNNDIEIVNNLIDLSKKDIEEFYSGISKIVYTKLKRISKDDNVCEYLKDQVKDLRDDGKKIIKSIKENFMSKALDEYVLELKELYPYMKYLFQLVESFDKLYISKKNEKGLVDFNDLEHYTLEILSNEKAAKEYRNKFEYIFVDEYQDSNLVQETIVNYIKREKNMFMVGDVKQSIYRFRLADPSLFIEKYENYSTDTDSTNLRIDLNKNFRSKGTVINGINYIFKNIMTKQLGEIDYDKSAYLYQGLTGNEKFEFPIELNIIEKNYNSDRLDEELEELENIEIEAKVASKLVKEQIGKEIYDNKKEIVRKVTYKDIVILLRTTKNWANVYYEKMLEDRIPIYVDTNTGYFDTVEVEMFLNLLSVIDNKMQDIELLSVMRSPIGRFTTEELIKIRIQNHDVKYFEAVLSYREIGEDSVLKEKCMKFVDKIKRWKTQSSYMMIDEFLWNLMNETGYYQYIGAMPGGIQRQANLRLLIDRARIFQKTSIKGLFNFIKFIEKVKNSSGDMGTAKILSENENVVRIMSIHKSKGLEFPVVLVGGMGKKFNLRDIYNNILYHKDLGIGPKYVNPKLRTYTDTIAKAALKNRIKNESLSEELRILYVALTRAKDKLILLGSISSLEKFTQKIKKGISTYQLQKANSYMDWILPVIFDHRGCKEKLRQWIDIDIDEKELIDDNSLWDINKLNRLDIQIEEVKKNVGKQKIKEKLWNFKIEDNEHNEFVNSRLNWEYPNKTATIIPSKMTVTEIKKLKAKEISYIETSMPQYIKKPKFTKQDEEFSPMEKGNIIHSVMQHISISKNMTKEEIDNQINEMVINELLKEEEAKIVESNKILRFFNSDIGKRLIEAKEVYREVPFNLVKEAGEVIPELKNKKEKLLVQGIIDCYFEEKGKYVLIDYKTDYINEFSNSTSVQIDDIVKRYKVQMELYKEALEKIKNKEVKEMYLYLFDIDRAIKIS